MSIGEDEVTTFVTSVFMTSLFLDCALFI